MNDTTSARILASPRGESAKYPGIALAAAVSAAAYVATPYVATVLPLPTMVVALIIGMALSSVGALPVMLPGLSFCVKTILRWSVALMGVRVALADIAALGLSSAIITVAAMVVTVICGFALARLAKQPVGFGALIGVGTAVCGASATLAVSAVVPNYRGKETDIVFVIVALNALATLAMVSYPPICALLGFDPQTTGVILGATIHDVAQVAGAGYAVSPEVGNTAVIVKLLRVFLLLPTIMCVAIYFNRLGMRHGEARVTVPGFAIVFLILCIANSAMALLPSIDADYRVLRSWIVETSNWGLLIAIAALGLGTSLSRIASLGWRHISTIVGTTAVIFIVVVGAELLLR
jgi:uncharacterized integral membrane protein (TIGR00698 family)